VGIPEQWSTDLRLGEGVKPAALREGRGYASEESRA